MNRKTTTRSFRAWALTGVAAAAIAAPAYAEQARRFDIPQQNLVAALEAFGKQGDKEILFSRAQTQGRAAPGLSGDYEPTQALSLLLEGSGLRFRQVNPNTYVVEAADPQGGSAGNAVQALIVTAQKREEDIQDVPIAISAFSQEDLTRSQVAGGPDLITQVPNMSFTKTNFTSYSIQIRGIGTQAISATTDPAVAVAFNNTPFIRNRFFEQEFYDLQRLEVLRGPQGTLYGRNATAGVVNLISAKPKFVYEAKASADLGNYRSTRIEGMINIPLVEDAVALRLAGAWTKRDGYATNQMTGQQIDGRDLWSTRLSLRFEPTDAISANLIWEHFEEDDDRLRSGKQLCKKHVVTEIGGLPITSAGGGVFGINAYTSQGCTPVSLYSEEAFQTPNGYALPFYGPTGNVGNPTFSNRDPYANAAQSRDLRVIESSVEPDYRAKSDIAELQISIDLSDSLTLASETSYSTDELWSLQDYNRFTTATGAFGGTNNPERVGLSPEGVFCDPQLGCSDRLLLVDLSTSESSQFSQEFRLGSDFDGPFNFSLGANYLRHDAEDKYYVFINSVTMLAAQLGNSAYVSGVTDNSHCMFQANRAVAPGPGSVGYTAPYYDPNRSYPFSFSACDYIDPNPIGALNDQGRNYFLSRNPYKLISYAVFGEAYYNITEDLKVTGGLRWTVDKKQAPQIPSWLLAQSAGPYPTAVTVDQEWREPTGRLAIDWKPHLSFTDETLVYASYAHGYKAGGANPPPPVLVTYAVDPNNPASVPNEILPETFGPEFVDAFEVGTKNTLFDGALTLNLTGFYYDYKGYQTSEIRNRSAVNSNFDAEVWGAEVELDWRPTEALKLGFKGGYNGTRMADGSKAIDLMDRTAGNEDWIVVRPFPTVPSNCIIPVYVATAGGVLHVTPAFHKITQSGICVDAYYRGVDPITGAAYEPNPTVSVNHSGQGDFSAYPYPGFDPTSAPNGGRGFDKDLSGNELPNAPRYTATVTADYTLPLAGDWLMTLHGDYHYQSQSWGRVINSDPFDRINALSTVNFAGIFTNEDAGWKVMAYVKNVFDETAITGTFLNSDDTGLTTNVFLTEPRLYGVRVTKEFTGGGWLGEIGRCDGECPLTVEIGGGVGQVDAPSGIYAPDWLELYSDAVTIPTGLQEDNLDWGDMRSVKLAYAFPSGLRISAAHRFGKMNSDVARAAVYEHVPGGLNAGVKYPIVPPFYAAEFDNHWRGAASGVEEHEITDFRVGQDMGFGMFDSSTVAVGLRRAELTSTSSVIMDGVPNRFVPPVAFPLDQTRPQRTRDAFTTSLDTERTFEGAGPMAAWDASVRLWGDDQQGHADLDWSVAGGVLFGEKTVESRETRFGRHYSWSEDSDPDALYDDVVPLSRTEDVTVPNISLSLGLSYSIDRVKVSTGYSYDRFFDAIDGGWRTTEDQDRTIQGPYFKIAVGFGG